MTAPAPTFVLPACGACSHRGLLERPIWRHAHHTTAKRKRGCYLFSGCAHAATVAKPDVIVDDPAEWARIEAAWALRTAELFAARTASWSDVDRERFRRELDSRAFLPGVTESLNLSPAETPAQQSNEPEKHQ